MSDEPTFDIFTDEIAGADAPPTPADAAERDRDTKPETEYQQKCRVWVD